MSDASPTTACPDAATLRALLDGTLPNEQQATTQAHVDRCPTCETALRQMTAGGESWIGMAEKLKSGSDEDPKLAAALERLKADDGSGGESTESATDPQRTLDFLQPADDPKLLGKLGQHEISEVVGWGGMGVVLKAYDPSLHRVVAVKVLASHLAHHAVARKRFIREAQAAAAVCHDNVVTIHAIEDGGAQSSRSGTRESSDPTEFSRIPLQPQALPKIIMQFVAGGSLQERIDQEAPLELKEILRIAMQTAAGLAAAHAQGVVHRDVKPANILLENGVQRVKLTDFGLARVMDDASLTLSGVIAGTPQYMAPEQAWGRDVDARADLFSLGAVMYAMCSGHSPFRARTTMAVLKRVCEDAPRPLRAINPDVPDWLVEIIEKLLAKKPEDRFQTATEVSELLGRWLAHVQQPSVVERPQTVSARRGSPGARRGSPDPAAAPDRRSPGFSRNVNGEGDLRSNTGAGSGDPRTARVSQVTLARMLIPVSIFVATFMLILVDWSFGWVVNPESHRDTPQEIFFKRAVLALGQVLLAACCYGLFYIGWNTRGGRQCAAMSIVLGVLAWTFTVAFDHLSGAMSQLFLLQAVLCGGYLLAILVRLVSRHGLRLLELPGLSAGHAADDHRDDFSARRGSPDPAAPPDRRSPGWSRGENQAGDLRSRPGAGSGDPRTAQGSGDPRRAQVENLPHDHAPRGRLSFKQTHWPVLITVAALSVALVLIVNEFGTRNFVASLCFCLAHLALTFALCSAFYCAWNTSSWLVWAGATLFLLVSGTSVLWTTTAHFSAQVLLGGEQALLAFGFLFCLLFIRPLFVRGSGKWMSERLTGWQQLFAIACFTIVGTPLLFLMMYWLSYSPRSVPHTNEGKASNQLFVLPTDKPVSSDPSPDRYPKPKLLAEDHTDRIENSYPPLPQLSGRAKATTIPDSLKPLLGRWVVVSSEGVELGSAGMPIAASESGGPTSVGASSLPGMAGFGGAGAGPGGMMMGGPAVIVGGPPVQWIEFAADHVVVFNGRQAKLIPDFSDPEFSEEVEPCRFSLRDPKFPPSDYKTDWRYGIYRLERDRLILCWTTQQNEMPTEFAGSKHSELLVLRREWNPPPEYKPKETPPPRATVPFTASEAKLLQAAWADSVDVGVETTNAIGMKLRLLPVGTFDEFQQQMLDGNLFGSPVCHPAVARPLYFGKHEVTVAQFRKFVEATGYQTSAERSPKPESLTWRTPGIVQDSDEHPVVHVSWEDAQAFCRWLSETTQEQYRLPTLAEWAFAARAGLGVSNSMKAAPNARLKFFDTTTPVGKDTANLFGLHDLLGNAAEWTNQLTLPEGDWLAVGGGFRSSITGEGTSMGNRGVQHVSAWLMARRAGDSASFDDVGFRVVRVIGEDAVDFSELLPQVQALVATTTRIKVKEFDGPVMLVRGLFPAASLPQPLECVDFEIERAQVASSERNTIFAPARQQDLNWQKIGLASTLKFIKDSEFTVDSVPALLTSNVLTMPLPTRTDAEWTKDLVTHPQLPATPPKTKYDAQYQLFRFIDFAVAPGQSYAYRVRLKFTPPGKQESKRVIFNAWSSESDWVAIDKGADGK